MSIPQPQPDANDVLMGGGGAPSATWPAEGSTVGGRIVAKPQSYHVREFNRANPGAGALAYYPSGDPIMGIRVDVQTADRLAADDDGVRRLYVEKKRQLAAVRDAVRSIGETGIQSGGHLTMTWTGLEQGEGTDPAKTWAATYRAPTTPVPGAPVARPQDAYRPAPPAQAPPVQSPGPPPAWAQPAAAAAYAPADDPWASYTPQPQPNQWAAPVAAPAPYQPQAQYAPPAQAAPVAATPTITETQAAAMRNAGIDTSLFAVIPG